VSRFAIITLALASRLATLPSGRHFRHLLLPRPPSGGVPSSLQRGLVGHAIEPVGDPLPRHDGGGFPDEDKEGGLKSIFGVVVVE